MAGLLPDDAGYRPPWTTRVVLVEEDEVLTAWMSEHRRVSWCVDPQQRVHEPG